MFGELSTIMNGEQIEIILIQNCLQFPLYYELKIVIPSYIAQNKKSWLPSFPP